MVTNGQERLVAFSSLSLTKTEREFAHTKREALAIIFGVCKFHQLMYGRMFMLQTDHDSANYKLREFKMHDGVQVKNFKEEQRSGNMVLLSNN